MTLTHQPHGRFALDLDGRELGLLVALADFVIDCRDPASPQIHATAIDLIAAFEAERATEPGSVDPAIPASQRPALERTPPVLLGPGGDYVRPWPAPISEASTRELIGGDPAAAH